jgi:Cys-rich protein (TIGR01571 family)
MSETTSRHSIAASRKNRQLQTSKSESLTGSRQPSNLNLRHNDNSFHVLASILVEFFQERVSQEDDNKTLILKPADREILQRLLPRSAVWDFIDAVNYRLEVTPVIAVSPIHFLSLQCQELCFDKDDQNKNPILIIYSLEKESISLNVHAVLSDAYTASVSNCELKMHDVFAHNEDQSLNKSTAHFTTDENIEEFVAKANVDCNRYINVEIDEACNDSDFSSYCSVIKIASSKDIAKEIKAKDIAENSLQMQLQIAALSSDDHMASKNHAEIGIEKPITRNNGSKTGEEPNVKLVDSNDEEGNDSDLSSDGSAIKIASSKDIAEEILAEIKAKDIVDDSLHMKLPAASLSMAENILEVGIEKPMTNSHGSKMGEESFRRTVESNDEKSHGSSDGSCIKIASSKDIAEEILSENSHLIPRNLTEICIEKSTTQIVENKTGTEPIDRLIDSNDEECDGSDLSSDGSAIKIASSKDIAEAIFAEVYAKVEKPTTEIHGSEADENPISRIPNTNDEIVIVENIKTSIVIIPNEDSVSVRDQHLVSDITSKVNFENDDWKEEGEEIEVLPTLTYSNDELSEAQNEKLEGNQDILDISCSLDFASENDIPTHILHAFSQESIEVCSDVRSMVVERSCQQDKENGVTTRPTGSDVVDLSCPEDKGNSKVDDVFILEKNSVRPTTSPVSEYTNKAGISINSVSRSIQDAAGTFFEDIRWAIDEKIIAFEDAVVDAIVAKPMKKDKFDFHLECDADTKNSSESCTVSKQQAFESIVREQIPDLEPQKRIKSHSEESGLSSFFGGITTGFSPAASEKTYQNGLTFPSDEGSAIGSHLSVPDLAHYDSMNVVDVATKKQLILEAKEALTLMKQSITPETMRFWRDHIQSLQNRLDSLRVVPKQLGQAMDVTVPMDSRNVDCSRRQKNGTVELWNRDSPTDLSDVRSIFGIPVVPGFFQFSAASTAQDDSSSKLAPKETQAAHMIPEESINDWMTSPPADPEIELCHSSNKETKAETDYSEEGPFTPPGIEPFDSDYEYPLVDVVAPADLPGGYHFEAEIEGQRFLATVPPGGVQQGETFTCYMRELDSVAIDIPVGDWKDGLCNMCDLGWCHPVLWNALFCPLIALGQIQTRVSLDFLGRPKFSELPYSNRFMMLTVVGFWLFTNVGLFAACNVKWSHGLELSVADVCAFVLVNVAMFGFVVFVTQSTRSSVREKFMIRERQCYDLEDVCCATLCLPCTVGQMSRHTANYDDYEAVCCSKTGLPNGVRVNQEPAKGKETTTENKDGYMV